MADKPSSSATPSGRRAAVRVKTRDKRSVSSARWLERHLNDPYVAEATKRGYRSRAAFKLLQLDEKYKFLSPGKRVVDLGAAPGGWTQVAVEKVRSNRGDWKVVGLDILPMDPVPGAITMEQDFLEDEAPGLLKAALGGQADVVLSDMAAPTIGHPATDHLRIMGLVEVAYHFAEEVLAQGGTFIAKVFQGGTEREMLNKLKRDFASVRHFKPAASRPESSESYIVALGFRGGRKAGEDE